MSVSILIPYVRMDGIQRCLNAIKKTTQGFPDIEVLARYDKERRGCTTVLHELMGAARFDLLCFLGDDCEPLAGWLDNATGAMETLPDAWGCVGLKDVHKPGRPCHFLVHRRMIDTHLGGEMFHTGYKHLYGDDELILRSQQAGRYVFAEDALILHHHPAFGKGKSDADYERVYAPDNVKHDADLFRRRKENNWKG